MSRKLPKETVQAWARLIRVEQTLLAKVEQELKAADLPPLDWYDVLLELDREADGRLRHRDLYPRLLVAKYNLSRLIDRMEAAGLVCSEACADDARGAVIAITAKGRALRKRMWPIYEAAIDRHFASRLSDGDIALLGRVLEALR